MTTTRSLTDEQLDDVLAVVGAVRLNLVQPALEARKRLRPRDVVHLHSGGSGSKTAAGESCCRDASNWPEEAASERARTRMMPCAPR